MNKTLGRNGYSIEMIKFRTGKRDKTGAPIFEEIIVKNFCGKRDDYSRKTPVYHVEI